MDREVVEPSLGGRGLPSTLWTAAGSMSGREKGGWLEPDGCLRAGITLPVLVVLL